MQKLLKLWKTNRYIRTKYKQEMLHVLTNVIKQVTHASIRKLKYFPVSDYKGGAF